MAITYFGRTAVPTDGGTNAGPTVTIAPPASMVADDFVLVFLNYKTTSTTLTFSQTAVDGQTWTSETKQATGATMSQWFKCKFNGTWLINPVFTISSGGTAPMSGVMTVWRGVDTTTAIDNADTNAAFAAPADPFDVTITGIDPTTDGSFVVAAWATVDDNSWTVQTAGWTNPASEAQWKNLAGTDGSVSIAYLEVASGSSGNVTNRQHTITGDAGSTHIIAIRSAVTALSLTMPTIASGAALNVPTLTPGAVALTMPTIASGASINVPTLAQVIALPTIASGAALNVPTLSPGAVALTMPTIASGAVLTTPTLTPGAVALTMPTIASGEATNAPTMTPGSVALTMPTIVSGEQTFEPELAVGAVAIEMPTIASGEELFAPTVSQPASQALEMPTIASGATLFAPTVTGTEEEEEEPQGEASTGFGGGGSSGYYRQPSAPHLVHFFVRSRGPGTVGVAFATGATFTQGTPAPQVQRDTEFDDLVALLKTPAPATAAPAPVETQHRTEVMKLRACVRLEAGGSVFFDQRKTLIEADERLLLEGVF